MVPLTGVQQKRTGIRTAQAGRQKIDYSTTECRPETGGAPVRGRGAGQAKNHKAKRHRSIGPMRKLQLQTVRGHPQHVPPTEGRPDGSQEKPDEQGLGRRRGWVLHPTFKPHYKRQRQRQALATFGRGGGNGKGTDDRQLQAGLHGRQTCRTGHPC